MRTEADQSRWQISAWPSAGLALLILALWMLARPFRGIAHDSVVYTLFAMARLHPESVGHDFSIALGTQDHYTLFTPLYAWAIRAWGIDHAAALITFITQAGSFTVCWQLARRFMHAHLALLAMALLVALPGFYGGGLVFGYVEMFATPRQPAEVLVLAGLLAALSGRKVLAGLFMLAGMLLHPIIAAAGVALWAVHDLALPRPRQALLITGCLAIPLVVVAGVLPIGPFAKFDPAWFDVLWERLKYLWPTQWNASDWYAEVLAFGPLIMGTLGCAQQQLRRVCLAVLIASGLGLLAAMAGGDLLHLVLVVKIQMWRCVWLSGLMSALLVPRIVADCWRLGDGGRAAVLLLSAAWFVQADALMLIPLVAGCLCLTPYARAMNAHDARVVLYGASITLTVCAAIWVAHQYPLLRGPSIAVMTSKAHYAQRIGQFQVIATSSALPLVLVLLWMGLRHVSIRSGQLITLLGAALCVGLAPHAWSNWTQVVYSAQRIAAFEPWRQIIPAGTEVLFPSSSPPVDAWFLLQRASYWSLSQMSGMVFSKELTVLSTRREDTLGKLPDRLEQIVRRDDDTPDHPVDTLARLCAIQDLRFIASWQELGPTPYPTMTPPDALPGHTLRLYRCGQ